MSYNRKAIADALSKMNKARKPKQPKDIIKDPEGQYKYPGVPTRIASDNITMQGVSYPVLGVDNLGNQQMMYPGAEYIFPGADYVDEFPMMQGGGQRQPIYVTNPKDPRLIAYQDSLNLYKSNSTDITIQPQKNFRKGTQGYNVAWGIVSGQGIQPESFNFYPNFNNPGDFYDAVYAKPQQPVKVKTKPDPAIVAKQQQLLDAGYDIGAADGIWGPKSEAAWREYQNKVENQPTETSTQSNPTSGVPPLDVAPIDNPVVTPQTVSPQGSQQPPNTNQQAPAAPQPPSGYNYWTDHLGQHLDPNIYGWAPSNNPRQIDQHAQTYALKRANEAYQKLGATPWATEGNRLVVDMSKPYFSKTAATNALPQLAEQLGVPVEQLEIVKAPAGYSGYVVIQKLSTVDKFQKGGVKMSREEFEKRKAAYKKLTGRDLTEKNVATIKQQQNLQKFIDDKKPLEKKLPTSEAEAMAMIESGELKIETIAQQQAREKREADAREADRIARLKAYEKRQADPNYGAGLTPLPGETWRDFWAAEGSNLDAVFRTSQEDNFFDDYINPLVWIGSMAKNLGESPQQAKQTGSLLPYITAVGTPLVMGAIGGAGATNTGQFVNNLVNPVAGLGTGMLNRVGRRSFTPYLDDIGSSLNPRTISNTPRQLPGSPVASSVDDVGKGNINVRKNLEDLKAAQNFAEKYDYDLPKNIERISQSNILTDRTIRGLMNRHNTFVRGVSTNWEEIGKNSPQILKHLKKKGFDVSTKEGTKAAAEYMTTHVPIKTGYGRVSLNKEVFNRGMEGLYTSNSIPTAEGYTYGQGYVTKVKRPTDFSSVNRQDWISKNNPQYYEHTVPKVNKGFKSLFIPNKKSDLSYNILKTEHDHSLRDLYDLSEYESALDEYLLKKVPELNNFTKYNKEFENIKKKVFNKYQPEKEKLIKLRNDVWEKIEKEGSNRHLTGQFGNLNDKVHKLHKTAQEEVISLKEMYLDKNVTNWRETFNPNKYAHYIHLGSPGEKVFEPIRSWEITPDIWKNKSRGHFNKYTKGLSAMSIGGVIGAGAAASSNEYQQGGSTQLLDYFDTELTDQEIEQYKKGGCVVVKL